MQLTEKESTIHGFLTRKQGSGISFSDKESQVFDLLDRKTQAPKESLVQEHIDKNMGEPFGATIEKSFRVYEAALALGIRKSLGLEVPINVMEAITDPRESKGLGDSINTLVGTEGMIGDIADEVQPESKGGPLVILPERMFGIPTAEIPREALNELADLVGLVLNPKQILILNPIFKFGLATLKYTGTKAINWVKSILQKSKVKPGEPGKAVADKVKTVISEETDIPVAELDKASQEAIKELEVEVNKIGAESEAKLFKNKIPEEGKGTGEAFDPVIEPPEPKLLPGETQPAGSVFTEDMIRVEARLIREEIEQGIAGENLFVKDEFGVIEEKITQGVKSTFPPYYQDLSKGTSKKTIINALKNIEKGSKRNVKVSGKLDDLIEERLTSGKRYQPGTGQHEPARSNRIQDDVIQEEFKRTPEGKAQAKEEAVDDELDDFFRQAKTGVYGETGGFAESKIAQKPPLVEMPELVQIAKEITTKYPAIVKKLIRAGGMKAIGVARLPHGVGNAKIELFAGIFKDPVVAAKVLAHEIGHVADWLPHKTMGRGNILGRIASLKKYMKTLLAEYPGAPGPLTPKDRARLSRLAKKMAKEGQKATPEVTPEDVLAIWRDVKSFEKNRALNDWVAKLTRKQKSEVMKAAIKGKLPEWADFAEVYKSADPDTRALYRKLLKEELEKRRLFEKDVILKELKALTQKWKPFKEGMDPKYTKYRYSNEELYADAVSVLLNEPETLKSTAPKFYKAFFNYLERKPEFKKSYLDILSRAESGAAGTLLKRDKDLNNMFARGEEVRAETLKKDPIDVLGVLKKELIDNNAPRIKKFKQAQKAGTKINPENNPIYWAEEYPYTHAAYFEYLRTVENNVRIPLKKMGIEDNDFAKYLFLRRVTTQRAEVANPLGHTPDTATKHLDFLKGKLGEEKFAQMEQAALEFSSARAEHIIPILKQADMYDDVLQKAIEDNIETYAKFEVLPYLEKKFGKANAGRLFQQSGTLQEIENPLTATLLQDASLMRAAAIKMERKTFVDMMIPAFPDEVLPAKTQWNGRFHAPVEPRDPKMGMVTYLHKGEVKAWYLPKEIADNFNKGNLEAGKIVRAIGYITAPFKEIFVGKNPFWMTWNIQRDIKAMAKHLPGGNIPKALWYTAKSIPPAFKDVALNKSTKEVSEMYRQKMLVVGRYYSALDRGPEAHMDKVMRSFRLSGKKYENNVIKPFVKLWEFLDKPGRFSERVVKIAGFKQLKALQARQIKDGLKALTDKEIGHIVRTQAGSPDFLRKGHLSSLYNNIFLFSNAGKEGWRASLKAAKTNPLSYTWKTAKYDVLPKLMMYGGSIGWLGPKVKRMYDNIPDRDKANYICIPLGFTKSGKTAYFVMPHDFMGQAIAGTLWKSINTKKTEDIQALFDFTMGGLPYSSLNPVVGVSIDMKRYITGKNPYNSWSGRNVVPESIFRAGGSRSHKEFAKHMWNSLGGSVVYRFRHDNIDEIKGELESLYGIPLVGSGLSRFVRVSDYGVTEQLREVKDEKKKVNANDLLDAKDVLYKIMDGKPLTDADRTALAKKPGVIMNEAILKLTAQKYGETALEEYLSASTNEEAQAVLDKWNEINAGYPAPSLLNNQN